MTNGKKFKVLYISHSPKDAGGAEISLRTLAEQFKKDGHEIIYLSLESYPGFKTYIFKKFKPIYSFELYEIYLSRFIQKVIEKEKPDLIHANDRFANIPSVIAARKKNIPVVVHFRDFSLMTTTGLPYSPRYGYFISFDLNTILKTTPLKRVFWEIYKYFYIKRRYKIINKADAKVAISRSIQEWLEKCGIRDSIVLPNPISPEKPKKPLSRESIRKQFGIPKNSTVLLFLSGFSIGKGIDIIFKLISRSKSLKGEIYFLLVGEGVAANKIKELSKRNKKIIYIETLPHNEIYKAYVASDIVLLPSKMEPFSRIVIEAMSMERPVISSNTGGGREAIINGQSGMLVDPENVGEWITAINSLIQNKQLLSRFKSNYKEIVKKYAPEESYKNFLNLYKQLTKSSFPSK